MKLPTLFTVMLLLGFQGAWADGQGVNKYAVVFDSISLESPVYKQHIQEQAAELIKLWKQGKVENIYLNHDAEQQNENRKASIVFFIEADSKDEANKVLEQLPFVMHDVLSYELHPVGVLWLKHAADQPEMPKN